MPTVDGSVLKKCYQNSATLPVGRWRGYHRSPHLRRCENWICKPSETRLRNHSRPTA